jgi:haloalkane dehalogenase
MIPADETFDGTWPFEPNFSEAAGFRQHYVDEGPRDGEVVICLHGEPTWGYLYRNFIPPLAERYRVIVPDHMGFGKSETPQDRVYTLKTHVENLEKLIGDLDLQDITFVCQDWGGPITGAYTIRHPERVKRLFLMNTLFGYGGATPPEEKTPWFQWIEKHEEAGTLGGIVGELGSTALSVMKIVGFQNTAAVTDTWIRAYSAPFPDREEPGQSKGRARLAGIRYGRPGHRPGMGDGGFPPAVPRRARRAVTGRRSLLPGRCTRDAGGDDPAVYTG